MRTVWKVSGNTKLLLFFSGWAMDENMTSQLSHEGTDSCTCFDYTNLDTMDTEKWKSYTEVILIAWSTGVWAAEQVIGKLQLPISEAIAINGTPTTVHDQTGIPRTVFQGTYDQLSPQSIQKFQRRMLGSATAYKALLPFLPKRSLESQKRELEMILSVNFETLETGRIKWNKAIIGTEDAIFPPQNQFNYWSENSNRETGPSTEIVQKPLPHYPFTNDTSFF